MLRRALDGAVGVACRVLLRIFFRRVEVVGRDRIPYGHPLIVVANHVNGLVDPMFLFGPLHLAARTLGKSTLWKIPILAQILDIAGVIPVYRPTDPGVDPARNLETFRHCHELLARRGVIAIFPEGTSHDEPHLQPLKTGAARIALEAETRFPGIGVRIVPVGLLFEERTTFRSRALVVVGHPIDPSVDHALATDDPWGAAREMTERIEEGLRDVTLNYESWEEALLVERGATIFERHGSTLPRRRLLAADFVVRRALVEGLADLRREHPEDLSRAITAIREYDRLLGIAGLRDEHVSASWALRPSLMFFFRTLVRVFVGAPAAVVGTVLNIVPYWIVDRIAATMRHEPNQVATYKIYPSLVVYPLCWTLEAIAAGARFGTLWGVALALVAGPCGYAAVRFGERRETLWRESRAFLLLRRHRKLADELRARHATVIAAIQRLIALWRGPRIDASQGA